MRALKEDRARHGRGAARRPAAVSTRMLSQAGFPDLSLLPFWTRTFLSGGRGASCTMFRSIAGLYPLEARDSA